MDYFDLAEPHGGVLADAFRAAAAAGTRFVLISFTSDWLYPTPESKRIVRALHAAGAAASFVELESPHGHDAFLLDAPDMNRIIHGFLASHG
jgi:homoserine O-acetyltransferase